MSPTPNKDALWEYWLPERRYSSGTVWAVRAVTALRRAQDENPAAIAVHVVAGYEYRVPFGTPHSLSKEKT